MRRYLLDTNASADCIFRRRDVHGRVKQARAAGHKIGIGIPVLGEILAGVESSASRARNLEIVDRNVGLFRLWPYTAEAARVYGRLFAELRRIGRPMQATDIQIAAIALSLGNCTVVTTDADLSAVPALSVESWAS
ncbi:MAG: type II toxin-antitoxin system VapC family toxin [Isosphaerales bacterium]